MTSPGTGVPELSVVIVTYRCRVHLERCLQSLPAAARGVTMEVIVVDNASGDGTLAPARARPATRVIERSRNDGFARAANEGMDQARGRAVLVLNPDTVAHAGSLRACLDALWSDPSVGVLTARVVDTSGRLDQRCRRSFPTAWTAFAFVSGLDRMLPAKGRSAYLLRHLPQDQPADVDAVSGAFMLMPRRALHDVGGFDQQFFMYAEDIDLCMRFRGAGYAVRYWPGATVTHEGGGCGDGRPPRRAEAAAFRTMAPLVRKHRPGPTGWLTATVAAIAGEILLAWHRLRRA